MGLCAGIRTMIRRMLTGTLAVGSRDSHMKKNLQWAFHPDLIGNFAYFIFRMVKPSKRVLYVASK